MVTLKIPPHYCSSGLNFVFKLWMRAVNPAVVSFFKGFLEIREDLRHETSPLAVFGILKRINGSNHENGQPQKSRAVDFRVWTFSQISQNP